MNSTQAPEVVPTAPARLARTAGTAPLLINKAAGPQTGIVHLGLGNFHRAHQAVYTAEAITHEPGHWGILGVAPRSRDIAQAMLEQDLLYTVLEISPEQRRPRIPAIHTGAVVAADDQAAVVAAIADPATKIITLTVTEYGYTLDPRTHTLDLAAPDIRHDLTLTGRSSLPGHTPLPEPVEGRTTVALLVHSLLRRFHDHGGPISILSCDNLSANGDTTRAVVRTFVEHSALPDRRALLEWIDESVTFPNSMVDRIVPATTDAYRDEIHSLLGVRDTIPVPAEPFGMWVMEDTFAAGRPAWDRAGAIFSSEVDAYELIKLRLLNGTHSLIAYLGVLAGQPTIPASIGTPFIAEAANSLLRKEYLPTVKVPGDIDIEGYISQLFDRWANTALGHRSSQVGTDGSVKLAQRVPQPALAHLAAGHMPHHLALTVAAYLCCVAPPSGFDPGPIAGEIRDQAQDQLHRLRAAAGDPEFTQAVFDTGLFGAELADSGDFVTRVAEFSSIIIRHGPEAAAAEAR